LPLHRRHEQRQIHAQQQQGLGLRGTLFDGEQLDASTTHAQGHETMEGAQHKVQYLRGSRGWRVKVKSRKLEGRGGGVTISVSSTKSKGNTTDAAINIASTGLPRVGLSIMKPQRRPQDDSDSAS
jgi:hypothetical protein